MPAQVDDFLWQNDAELGDQPAHPVIGRCAFFDKTLSRAVQAENDLLMLFLDWDEAHVGTRHGLADRSSVRRIVLAALAAHAIGRDELRSHELDAVAMLAKQPCPVVRARAGFHTDDTGRQLRDERQKRLS